MAAPTNGAGFHSHASGPQKTVYLVTGASRGIGKGLVSAFLLRPQSIVIACVRDPAGHGPELMGLAKASDSELIITKLDCARKGDAAAAVESIRSEHSITQLDVVIANAAIATDYGPASTMPVAAIEKHMMVNAYSVLLLFQATTALLQAAKSPRFVLIGAPIGTITEMDRYARAPLFAYGLSKLAANYLVRKLHFENKWLIAFIIDPGHVQTDMGDQGARLMGRKEAPTTIQESITGVCAQVDAATKESISGLFVLHEDGSVLPW